jgi:hypothetical protein
MMKHVICMRGMINKYFIVIVMSDGKRDKPITSAFGPKLEDMWKGLLIRIATLHCVRWVDLLYIYSSGYIEVFSGKPSAGVAQSV